MLSFFGEQTLKDSVIARVKEHQRLDQIIQRVYWDGQNGCAIGCVLHSHDHMAYETQLGLPVFLAYMDEHIFEELPLNEATAWPLRFLEAVPVGVDLALVFPRFTHWLLSDPQGVRQYADATTLPIIDALVTMYAQRIEGIPFDLIAAEAVAEAARAAAWMAAGAAAGAAARAARAAAMAAEAAARAAAWMTPGAAAGAAGAAAMAAMKVAEAAAVAARAVAEAAGAAAIHRQADYLIALLQSFNGGKVHGIIVEKTPSFNEETIGLDVLSEYGELVKVDELLKRVKS